MECINPCYQSKKVFPPFPIISISPINPINSHPLCESSVFSKEHLEEVSIMVREADIANREQEHDVCTEELCRFAVRLSPVE